MTSGGCCKLKVAAGGGNYDCSSEFAFDIEESGCAVACSGVVDFSFPLKKMYLAIKICICYNVDRQKAVISPYGQETNPRTVLPYCSGILLFFYTGKAPSRLFIIFMTVI